MREPRTGGPGEVIGKTITGVVVKDGWEPDRQVFLLFSDGTSYEFYGDVEVTSGVDPWDLEKVVQYMGRPVSRLWLEPPPRDGDRRKGVRERRAAALPLELPPNVLPFRRSGSTPSKDW